jgi:MFS family permease
MQIAIPNFGEEKYSALASATTVVLAFSVLFTGLLSDKFNRKWLIVMAATCWSTSTLGSSLA